MAVVWPCPYSIDSYIRAERAVRVPPLNCPRCRRPFVAAGGYQRHVRWRARRYVVWIRRGHCRACDATHALLPDFLIANHLDTVDDIAAAVTGPAPELPARTIAGWKRRYRANTWALHAGIAASVVARGGTPLVPDDVATALDLLHRVLTDRYERVYPQRWRLLNVITGMSWMARRVKSHWAGVGLVPIGARAP